ncbi:hypothetical protein ElyMa_002267300 [Elysia marginata]|uniref:Uncharacterized protein n=1 Tax=Elysia marginata TaxID=1093978 RepID=A0AAV4G279_9GAST|nr:hypothetical protein ElyMa_002267300 [Elysia marginata]
MLMTVVVVMTVVAIVILSSYTLEIGPKFNDKERLGSGVDESVMGASTCLVGKYRSSVTVPVSDFHWLHSASKRPSKRPPSERL